MKSRKISVIIPVLHEREIINDLVLNLRSIEGGKKIEILVVDGSDSHDTIEVINDPNVIKLISQVGRGSQMNIGAKKAKGEIIVFLHVDTILPSNAFGLIEETLSDKVFSAGAFTLTLDNGPLYLRLMVPINNLRGRLTRVPYGDQAIFMKKRTFQEIGGYREIRIMEDLDLMRRMKRSGLKVKILKGKVRTSSRRFLKKGPMRTVFVNIFLIFLFHLGVDNERLARIYYGN